MRRRVNTIREDINSNFEVIMEHPNGHILKIPRTSEVRCIKNQTGLLSSEIIVETFVIDKFVRNQE